MEIYKLVSVKRLGIHPWLISARSANLKAYETRIRPIKRGRACVKADSTRLAHLNSMVSSSDPSCTTDGAV